MRKRWLVTGASRGLGRALAEAALEAGHQVVAGARDPRAPADLAESCGAARAAADQGRLAQLDRWRELSRSTDYPTS